MNSIVFELRHAHCSKQKSKSNPKTRTAHVVDARNIQAYRYLHCLQMYMFQSVGKTNKYKCMAFDYERVQ